MRRQHDDRLAGSHGTLECAILGDPADSADLPADVGGGRLRGLGASARAMTSSPRLRSGSAAVARPRTASSSRSRTAGRALGASSPTPGQLLAVPVVDRLRTAKPSGRPIWRSRTIQMKPSIPGSAYFVYGDAQLTYEYRGEHVPHILQVSVWPSVLLLNGVRSMGCDSEPADYQSAVACRTGRSRFASPIALRPRHDSWITCVREADKFEKSAGSS
jgi:hypothetical protein